MDQTDLMKYAIPVVALRGLVVFPDMVLHFDIARQKSINAVNAAMEYGQKVFLTSQKDSATEEPSFTDLYKNGVVAKIRQVITVPESGNLRVIVEGESRAQLEQVFEGDFLYADVKLKPEQKYSAEREEYAAALLRKTREIFDEYSSYSPKVSPDVLLRVSADDSPGGIADYIASLYQNHY